MFDWRETPLPQLTLVNIVRLEIGDNNRKKDRLVITKQALRTGNEPKLGKFSRRTESGLEHTPTARAIDNRPTCRHRTKRVNEANGEDEGVVSDGSRQYLLFTMFAPMWIADSIPATY